MDSPKRNEQSTHTTVLEVRAQELERNRFIPDMEIVNRGQCQLMPFWGDVVSQRKKRSQTRDADRGEPSSARSESPGEVPVPDPTMESAPKGTESDRISAGAQESEAQEMGSGEEDLGSGGAEEDGAEESQIQILPLWAWGLVMVASFLIAFWLVSTYVLGAL